MRSLFARENSNAFHVLWIYGCAVLGLGWSMSSARVFKSVDRSDPTRLELFSGWVVALVSTKFQPRNETIAVGIFVFPQSIGGTDSSRLLEKSLDFLLR
mmetsp:Transcript_29602/g.61709  ORF Transcript_29602/g.61709 Transcript_29602/m.61709 type:complete len:99 (+) Transcript_29602:2386-2682(+)